MSLQNEPYVNFGFRSTFGSFGYCDAREYKAGDNAQLTYKQKFDFDRFGNLYRKAASNPTTGQQNPLPYTPIEDADISKQTNRFMTETTYDDAGQVINDAKFRDMGFAYDANGRQVKATKENTPDAHTVYDGFGNRVATKINGVWQYMIYDAFGQLIAEYGTSSQTNGIKYVQQDWQGSVRTVTSNAGFVASRTDHQAFGEEIGTGIGLRTPQQGYGISSSARQGYGLTEKDEATGLNHTWFRKKESQAGRWTSPDPYKGSMSLTDPRSFNRYSYVGNQPTNHVDPSGLVYGVTFESCGLFTIDFWNGEQWDFFVVFGCVYSTVYFPTMVTGDTGGVPGIEPPAPPKNDDCPEQDFGFNKKDEQDSNFNQGELSALAQTAVGESGVFFNQSETEAVIATAINRLSANAIYANQRLNMPFNGGLQLTGILSRGYDAHNRQSGQAKLDQAKAQNRGVLPAGYVCDQLIAAKNYIRRTKHGNLNSPGNKTWSDYPYTFNLGGGTVGPPNFPANAVGARATYGNTIFFNTPF